MNIVMTNHEELYKEVNKTTINLVEIGKNYLVSGMTIKELHIMNDRQIVFVVDVNDAEEALKELISSYENPVLTTYYAAGWESDLHKGLVVSGLFFDYDYFKSSEKLMQAEKNNGINDVGISVLKNVDNLTWRMSLSYSENESAFKALEDPLIPDLNELNLDFIEACDVDGNVMSRCAVVDESIIVGLIVFPEFRRKGVGTKMVEYCLEKYGYVEISTRSPGTKKICENLNFKQSEVSVSNYSNSVEIKYIKNKISIGCTYE